VLHRRLLRRGEVESLRHPLDAGTDATPVVAAATVPATSLATLTRRTCTGPTAVRLRGSQTGESEEGTCEGGGNEETCDERAVHMSHRLLSLESDGTLLKHV
jgi:hypothetical protein